MKVRTEARREAILDIARRVFLECGYERASMSEIARQVGGSKATLYGYFPSKEALFVAAALAEGHRLLRQSMDHLAQRGTEALRDALLRMGTTLVSFVSMADSVAAHRMVLAESGRSDIGQQFYEQGPAEGIQALSAFLQSAMRLGELRDADPTIAALHLHALLCSEVQARGFYRESRPLSANEVQAIAERAVDIFLRGYACDTAHPEAGRAPPLGLRPAP